MFIAFGCDPEGDINFRKLQTSLDGKSVKDLDAVSVCDGSDKQIEAEVRIAFHTLRQFRNELKVTYWTKVLKKWIEAWL